MRTFTTVIELEPEFARGWDGRGQSLMLQGKYEEAMLDFDRAIELKPNLAVAYSNRGLTRVAIDDFASMTSFPFLSYPFLSNSPVDKSLLP